MVLCILPPLLNLFCICYVLTISILFCVHLSMKYSLDISNFFEAISNLSLLLFSSVSLQYSFKKDFLSLLAILWKSAFIWVYLSFYPLPFPSLLSLAICKASSDNYFAFLHFFFFGMVMVTASCTILQTSIHSYLSTRSNPLNLFITSTV